jgi:hypothetical protein
MYTEYNETERVQLYKIMFDNCMYIKNSYIIKHAEDGLYVCIKTICTIMC